MKNKIPVGILGATGIVGQNYIRLLQDHPWFDIKFLAASERSAGKLYKTAVHNRWHMPIEIPKDINEQMVHYISEYEKALAKCRFVFSALELKDKNALREIEETYARKGIPVISNASAHRWTKDIPMIIPEINHSHLDLIPIQKRNRGFKYGFIVTKPNCSLQSYLTPIYALNKAGYEINKIMITTMQALSGAGYPGVASLDVIDNLIPFIDGEEEKTEKEPLKILGKFESGKLILKSELMISSQCNRVPVTDGHTACVNIEFKKKNPTRGRILEIWRDFRSLPQKLNLPYAPKEPIIYIDKEDRPQPNKDRFKEKGMAVVVGRLRECPIFDYKFVCLSHNTIRGAAGGGILNAELLVSKGFIK